MRMNPIRSVWILVLALPCVSIAEPAGDMYSGNTEEAVVVEATPVSTATDIEDQVARIDQQLQHVQQQNYLAKIKLIYGLNTSMMKDML